MYTSRKIALAFATASSLVAFSSAANAGGWLADTFVKPFSPHLAREADKLNDRLGNPVDHAIAAGANVVAPGTGTALEAGWALQRNGLMPSIPQGRFQPAQPQMQLQPQFNGGGYMPVNNVVIGFFCSTNVGRFGPGPANPVGAPCNVPMPNGQVFFGQVTQ